jgi:phosphate/sulfate permease
VFRLKKIMGIKSSTEHIVVGGILGEKCHPGLLYEF